MERLPLVDGNGMGQVCGDGVAETYILRNGLLIHCHIETICHEFGIEAVGGRYENA